MDGAGLEWATACVFAIAKPSAAKNMLIESAATAISRRRSMAAVNIGSSFCTCPFWAWRHKTPNRDATLCVNAHGKSFHTARGATGENGPGVRLRKGVAAGAKEASVPIEDLNAENDE